MISAIAITIIGIIAVILAIKLLAGLARTVFTMAIIVFVAAIIISLIKGQATATGLTVKNLANITSILR